MASAHSDRLNSVKNDLDALLVSRIGDLMGIVRASRELVDQIGDADRQIQADSRQRKEAERIGDADRVQEMDQEVELMRSLRDQLVQQLADLTERAR